jgi:hypothetical protein
MTNANVSIEIGLKTEISRQVGARNYERCVGNYNQVCMVNAWKCLYDAGVRDVLSEMIWEHISDKKGYGKTYYPCMSAEMGLLSVIKDTDKKGVVKKPAHYSIYGNYVGSIKDLGPISTSYKGNFLVIRSDFNLNLDKLPSLTPFDDKMELHKLFSIKNSPPVVAKPKPVVAKSPPVVAKSPPVVAKPKPVVAKKKPKAVPKTAPIPADDSDEDMPIGLLIRKKAVRT